MNRRIIIIQNVSLSFVFKILNMGVVYFTIPFLLQYLGQTNYGIWVTIFSIVNDETVFTKNKYFTYLVEVPFEFRWRNSTPTAYKFWRIYSGFKFGYVFANQAKYEGEPTNVKLNALDRFNKLQYGLTLSAGYNTWNIHMYYALNSIFDNNTKLDVSI